MESVKTILAVIGLVLIGFVGGFYAHRQMSKHFMKSVMEMRQPKGFQEHFYSRIEATDVQREELKPIVEDYAARIGEQHRTFRKARHQLIDSMHTEVKPILTTAQVEKLDQFSRRFRDRNGFRKRKKLK